MAPRRKLGEGQRRAGGESGGEDDAVDDRRASVGRLLQEPPGDGEELRRELVAARWVALPVITVTREAKAPMPSRMRSVWPWMTRIDVERHADSASAQTWAITVSTPCPTDAAPVTTSTRPSALDA